MTLIALIVLVSGLVALIAPAIGFLFMDVSDLAVLGLIAGKFATFVFVVSLILLVGANLGIRISVDWS